MSVRNEVPAQDDAGKVDPLALSHARPEWSASQPMTPAQKRWLFAVAAGVAGAALVWPLRTAQGLIAAGMTSAGVAQAAGVPWAAVKSLLFSRGVGRPPVSELLAGNAAAILAVPAPEEKAA